MPNPLQTLEEYINSRLKNGWKCLLDYDHTNCNRPLEIHIEIFRDEYCVSGLDKCDCHDDECNCHDDECDCHVTGFNEDDVVEHLSSYYGASLVSSDKKFYTYELSKAIDD